MSYDTNIQAMKKFILCLLIQVSYCALSPVFGQAQPATNTSCSMAMPACDNTSHSFDNGSGYCLDPSTGETTTHFTLFYATTMATNGTLNIAYSGTSASIRILGPFSGNPLSTCDQIAANVFGDVAYTAFSGSHTATLDEGKYIIEVRPDNCAGTIAFAGRSSTCKDIFACKDCVKSFAPPAGRYVVSAWVKEAAADAYTHTYTHTQVRISFTGSATVYTLVPSGKIIDGWQRIEQEIEIPGGATALEVKLMTTAGTSYFDDVRFFPFDGSMMSYVYDPLSLRLMAELDERNYATFYEYDEEGKLVRVKKETEKGVMTIQENRDNLRKAP